MELKEGRRRNLLKRKFRISKYNHESFNLSCSINSVSLKCILSREKRERD